MHARSIVIALALAASTAGAQSVGLAERAPELDLPRLGGGRVQLSTLRGHPVVLSFWGTWCPPCRSEFPDLVRAHEQHGAAGLVVVGVNGRDQEYSTKDVTKFVTEFAVPFPIALDERGRMRQAFHIVGLPTTVFIDSTGVVRAMHIGPITRAELESGIAAIMQTGR